MPVPARLVTRKFVWRFAMVFDGCRYFIKADEADYFYCGRRASINYEIMSASFDFINSLSLLASMRAYNV